ncbi:MAG: hypothetical protein WAQ98_02590 [Blastocatellia bacterium]
MSKKNKDLTLLIKEAKIYASIEAKHQKLVEYLEKSEIKPSKSEIKPSDKPIEEIEKDLLASIQRQGMDLSKHPSVREMAEHYGLLEKNSWQASLLTS